MNRINTTLTTASQTEERLHRINQLQSMLYNPGTLPEKLKRITNAVVDIFDADFARIWLILPGDLCSSGCLHAKVLEGPHACRHRNGCLHLLASSGRYTHLDGEGHRRVPFGCYKIGRVASGEEASFLTNDVTHDPRVHNHEWAASLGLVSFAGYQLRPTDGETIGVLALFSKHPLTSEEDALLEGVSKLVVPVVQSAQIETALRENEEKFRLMTETARDAIIMLDHDGKVTFWNQAAEAMLGYSAAEIMNLEIYPRLVPERFHEAFQRGFRHFQNSANGALAGRRLEFMAKRKDSVEIPVELSVSVIKLKGQRHALGIVRDITGRRLVEAKLNYERDLLRAVMDNSGDCIYFKDRESRFLRCSVGMAALFHLHSSDEFIGRCDHDFFSREHADVALADEQRIICTGEPVVGKVEKETWPDGRITWALTSKMPLCDDQGNIVGTFGISKNITDIKEAEAKINTLRHIADASREAGMAEVATSILHNIGNVLNSVNVSGSLIVENVGKSKVASLSKVTALLKEHGDDLPRFFANDPKGKRLVDFLTELAAHLVREQEETLRETTALMKNIEYIKEVVAMQQNYSKAVGLVEMLPPAELMEDALLLNLAALQQDNIKLVRSYAQVPPVPIERHKVLQILTNLISNARHACNDSGRAEKLVTLKLAGNGNTVSISVEDNGVGIPPENLTRIFGHGFAAGKGGHGFGLHSSALAAKALGGTLRASSEGPGYGAIFTLELPTKSVKASQENS